MLGDLEKFEEILIGIATTGQQNSDLMQQYPISRKKIIDTAALKDKLPDWIFSCRNGSSFWDFIKIKHITYANRRIFIRKSLEAAFSHVESLQIKNVFALDFLLPASTSIFNSEYIQIEWKKAIDRRTADPDGAMTIAKTMLESVCKHILDEFEIDYKSEKELTLQKLYSKTANALKLSAQMQTEKELKKILGSLSSIVDGLATIRGLVSDAHGNGKAKYKIAERHSVLAINSAFTLIIFLSDTFKEKKQSS